MIHVTRKIAGAAAAAALALAPGLAAAANFAYVNHDGEVQLVVAADWQTAIATAPNIATHSGVILLDGSSDPLLDDGVDGV